MKIQSTNKNKANQIRLKPKANNVLGAADIRHYSNGLGLYINKYSISIRFQEV